MKTKSNFLAALAGLLLAIAILYWPSARQQHSSGLTLGNTGTANVQGRSDRTKALTLFAKLCIETDDWTGLESTIASIESRSDRDHVLNEALLKAIGKLPRDVEGKEESVTAEINKIKAASDQFDNPMFRSIASTKLAAYCFDKMNGHKGNVFAKEALSQAMLANPGGVSNTPKMIFALALTLAMFIASKVVGAWLSEVGEQYADRFLNKDSDVTVDKMNSEQD